MMWCCDARRECFLWLLLLLICSSTIVLTVMAYKKPTFCNQDGDPFSFLWMIKGEPPSYLFGTIHVPYTAVWEHVPENAKQAFSVCRRVYFELDLLHPDTLAALATCQMLPQGKNLSDVLPSDLYLRLKRHLEYVRHTMPRWMTADQRGRGLFADSLFDAIAGNWERKRPVWVLLMVNSLTESDVRARGVPVLDLYLAQEAERLRKKTAAVEKVEEQCLPLNGLDLSQVVFALNHTLLQHEQRLGGAASAAYTTDDLIRHYNCGDLSAAVFGQDSAPLPALGNCSAADGEAEEEAALAKSTEAYFRRELIRNRNLRMGQRVGQLIRQNPGQSLFFAFGAGHFLGNNTVLDFVQAEGFEVEHLSVTEKIPKSKMKKNIPFLSEPDLKDGGRKTQSRRVNRHRSAGSFQRSGSSLNLRKVYETSPVPPPLTTQRPRRFNDLWVRLDPHNKKKSSSATGPLEDRQLPQQALRSWYQKSQEPASLQSPSNCNSLHHLHLHSKLMIVICVAELFVLGVFQQPQIALTGIS